MEAPGFSPGRGPFGRLILMGVAAIWELESLERGAARAGQPDSWTVNLAESSEHRERKPSAFLRGPLAQGTELVVSQYAAVIRKGFVCEHRTPLMRVSECTLWGQTQELGEEPSQTSPTEMLRFIPR